MGPVIDHTSFPDIIDAIVERAAEDTTTAYALRAISRDVRDGVDKLLFQHVRVAPCGSVQQISERELNGLPVAQTEQVQCDFQSFYPCSKHKPCKQTDSEGRYVLMRFKACCIQLLTPDDYRLPSVPPEGPAAATDLMGPASFLGVDRRLYENAKVLDFGTRCTVPLEFAKAEFSNLQMVRGIHQKSHPFPKMAPICVEILPFNRTLERWCNSHCVSAPALREATQPHKAEKVYLNAVYNPQMLPKNAAFACAEVYSGSKSVLKEVVIAIQEMDGFKFNPEGPGLWSVSDDRDHQTAPYMVLNLYNPFRRLHWMYHSFMDDIMDLLQEVHNETAEGFSDRVFAPRFLTVLVHMLVTAEYLLRGKRMDITLVGFSNSSMKYLNAFYKEAVASNLPHLFIEHMRVVSHEEYLAEVGATEADMAMPTPAEMRKFAR